MGDVRPRRLQDRIPPRRVQAGRCCVGAVSGRLLAGRMPIRPGDELGPALGQPDVLSAVGRVQRQVTASDSRISRTFAVLGILKISTIGSCHANQAGTLCGRPSGWTVPSQMNRSSGSRWDRPTLVSTA